VKKQPQKRKAFQFLDTEPEGLGTSSSVLFPSKSQSEHQFLGRLPGFRVVAEPSTFPPQTFGTVALQLEGPTRRLQWRDRGRFSRPFLLTPLTRGTTGTLIFKEQLSEMNVALRKTARQQPWGLVLKLMRNFSSLTHRENAVRPARLCEFRVAFGCLRAGLRLNSSMKTAVSIPHKIFEGTERLGRRTRKLRSHLFRDVLRKYLARHAPAYVTGAMDRACDGIGETGDGFASSAAHRPLRRAER